MSTTDAQSSAPDLAHGWESATGRHVRVSPVVQTQSRWHLRELIDDRISGVPAWVLLIQLFIGMGWLRAATEKAIDPTWLTGQGLQEFLADHETASVGWYRPILELLVQPNIWLVSALVMVLQLGVGISLVSGRSVSVGLAVGVFLNLHFVAAGAVNPSAFYLLAQGAVALWLFDRSRSPNRRAQLWLTAVTGATLAVLSLPFIGTLHLAEVIDDPAVMLVTGGLLTLLACDVAHRQATGGRGLP